MRYEGFILSHVVIFLCSYILIVDANVGWLAINIWHNLQYVLVVWMVNVKRYAGRTDRRTCVANQPARTPADLLRLLPGDYDAGLPGIDQFTVLVMGGGLAATLGIYMGINFHHYIVDALIWKRRAALRRLRSHGRARQPLWRRSAPDRLSDRLAASIGLSWTACVRWRFCW